LVQLFFYWLLFFFSVYKLVLNAGLEGLVL
jgi:hypothetical protein